MAKKTRKVVFTSAGVDYADAYVAHSDGHIVDVHVATEDDVKAGRVAAAGDLLAVRRGHGTPQWWKPETFGPKYARAEEFDGTEDLVDPEYAELAGDPFRSTSTDAALEAEGGVSPASSLPGPSFFAALDELKASVAEHLTSTTTDYSELSAKVHEIANQVGGHELELETVKRRRAAADRARAAMLDELQQIAQAPPEQFSSQFVADTLKRWAGIITAAPDARAPDQLEAMAAAEEHGELPPADRRAGEDWAPIAGESTE